MQVKFFLPLSFHPLSGGAHFCSFSFHPFGGCANLSFHLVFTQGWHALFGQIVFTYSGAVRTFSFFGHFFTHRGASFTTLASGGLVSLFGYFFQFGHLDLHYLTTGGIIFTPKRIADSIFLHWGLHYVTSWGTIFTVKRVVLLVFSLRVCTTLPLGGLYSFFGRISS